MTFSPEAALVGASATKVVVGTLLPTEVAVGALLTTVDPLLATGVADPAQAQRARTYISEIDTPSFFRISSSFQDNSPRYGMPVNNKNWQDTL